MNSNPNVFIRYGNVPTTIPNALLSTNYLSLNDTEFLLLIDKVAKYHVSNGNLIVIEPADEATDDDIRIFLLSSVIGALLHQRGMIAIHGSSIVYNQKGIIFAGNSGAGKSTLAVGMAERGYPLVADDLSVISFDNNKKLLLHPGYKHLKLWVETLDKLNKQTIGLSQIRKNVQKYVLKYSSFIDQPVEITHIYILSPSDKNEISILPLKGIEKFDALNKNTFRRLFLQGIEPRKLHFNQIVELSEKCIVKRIERPKNSFLLNELIDSIEEDLSNNT